jgi:hypothetical protein
VWSPAGSGPPNGLVGPALGASRWGRLQAHDVPAWLEPLSLPGQPFDVYRMRYPARSPAPGSPLIALAES